MNTAQLVAISFQQQNKKLKKEIKTLNAQIEELKALLAKAEIPVPITPPLELEVEVPKPKTKRKKVEVVDGD